MGSPVIRVPRPVRAPTHTALQLPLLLAAASLLASGCAGPEARRAAGPVATDIERALAGGTERFDSSDWSALLARTVKDGRVDYRALQADRKALDAYLERIAVARLDRLAPAHLLAMLINAYNALTIASILDHPDVASIRSIPGVWTHVHHTVGGHALTLDTIEHEILRPFFRDPRIHFSVNCASRSCAPLMAAAYDGDRIDSQLEERATLFLGDPDKVRPDGDALAVSSYFKWYGQDFTTSGWKGAAASIPAYIAPRATAAVKAFIESHHPEPALEFLDYDWSLNASRAPDPALKPPEPHTGPGPGPTWVDRWLPAAVAGALHGAGNAVANAREWVLGLGPAAPAATVAFYALSTVLFIPGAAITLAAGGAFGTTLGFAVVSAGSTLGAALAFLIARHLLRRRVEGWIAGDRRFTALDHAIGAQGWKIVALTRLSPVFPFNVLNYALGLTAIGFWPAVVTSWLAMMPGTFMYVLLGATAADAAAATGAEAASGQATAGTTGPLILKAVGLIATVVVTIHVATLASTATREALAPSKDGAQENRT